MTKIYCPHLTQLNIGIEYVINAGETSVGSDGYVYIGNGYWSKVNDVWAMHNRPDLCFYLYAVRCPQFKCKFNLTMRGSKPIVKQCGQILEFRFKWFIIYILFIIKEIFIYNRAHDNVNSLDMFRYLLNSTEWTWNLLIIT